LLKPHTNHAILLLLGHHCLCVLSLQEGLLLGTPLRHEGGIHYSGLAHVYEMREGSLTHMLLLLLLLLLLEHVCLLGLEVREGMRIRTDTWLHASHHGTGLTNRTVRARYSWVHLHALLHGVTGARATHHMALGHLHAGLWWKV
jgi:hypothetical protein